jgi:acyl carrier protein
MSRNEIKDKVTEVFRDVFDDDSIEITDATTAADIEDWDSLTHITLISEVESVFGCKFAMKDVIGMKDVGEMLDILEKNAK